MLRFISLHKSFQNITALNDINLNFQKNETIGLIGPNGSGKTTLLNIATGQFKADQGRIEFFDQDVSNLLPHNLAELGFSRTFQNIRVYKRFTVLENILAAIILLPTSTFSRFWNRKGQNHVNEFENAEWALECVGLIDQKNQLAKNLPLPSLRRLEIARIIARDPKVIFLDEPTGGMTPNETELMGQLIIEKVVRNKLCIIIEHKIRFIRDTCKRTCVLSSGKLIADGKTDTVLGSSKVKDAYLGVIP